MEQLHKLANEALDLWTLPAGASAELINLSENATFLVSAPSDFKAVLRVHRPGYNTRRAIESELAWLDALGATGTIEVPTYYTGRNGTGVQQIRIPVQSREQYLVLFHFIEGAQPTEAGDLTELFSTLGTKAALCHEHALNWERPADFVRPSWDVEAVFGEDASWGDWRNAPGLTSADCEILSAAEDRIKTRLSCYGKAPERFNLIHADMRLANLLIQKGKARLIDFDDCGFGWFMYDFAAAVSFMEDDERVPELRDAWLQGYTSVRSVRSHDIAEIPTFVMMRRLALLAWIGSRNASTEPQALAPHFGKGTRQIAERWLYGEFL